MHQNKWIYENNVYNYTTIGKLGSRTCVHLEKLQTKLLLEKKSKKNVYRICKLLLKKVCNMSMEQKERLKEKNGTKRESEGKKWREADLNRFIYSKINPMLHTFFFLFWSSCYLKKYIEETQLGSDISVGVTVSTLIDGSHHPKESMNGLEKDNYAWPSNLAKGFI